MTRHYIHKKDEKKDVKNDGKVKEKPWDKYDWITKEGWEKFEASKKTKKALVLTYHIHYLLILIFD